jgi:hypothetical protein
MRIANSNRFIHNRYIYIRTKLYKMKKNTRNDFIAFRVNSKDKALLQELSDNAEISLSALARKKVKELLIEAKETKR